MFNPMAFRFIALPVAVAIAICVSVSPAGGDDVAGTVKHLSRCAGGMSAMSELHPKEKARAGYKGFASNLDTMGKLYGALAELDDGIAENTYATGRRDMFEIVKAQDAVRHKAFLQPCFESLKRLHQYEFETVNASHAFALLDSMASEGTRNSEHIKTVREILQEIPDSVLAPLIRSRLAKIEGR